MDRLAERLDRLTPLQRAVFALKETQAKLEGLERTRSEPIAIVGMACRFPGGADSPEAFWRLLRDGRDAIRDVPPERWDASAFYDPDPAAPGKTNLREGGFLDAIDGFDRTFFGISQREAVRMDPQQRLLLELAWEALEDAGIPAQRLIGSRTGVFLGIASSEYALFQVGDPLRTDAFASTGTALCVAANRLSFFFDLRGPSLAVDTACSSSLVAVHQACQSLRSGESKVAVAGGVNLMLWPTTSVNLTKAGLAAVDGRCRAFDAGANGYVRGEGGGLVVLKPLSAALADGDPIHALIRGSAVNQDGKSNGIKTPNRQAQEAVLREALAQAGVPPGRVQYVEAQGTGTLLGDMIEGHALGNVLGAGRAADRPCLIGSVKTNIGHLEAAAGIAGLIKTVLALKHRAIPPSLHYEQPNPHLPFEALGLRVAARSTSWPVGDEPAVAGVSAQGFGGTNAHVVLEAAPPAAASSERPPEAGDAPCLIPLSAQTETALATAARGLGAWLEAHPEAHLGDVAYTLGVRRDHHDVRLALVAASRDEAIAKLDRFLRGAEVPGLAAGRVPHDRRPGAADGGETLETLATLYTTGRALDWGRLSPAGSRFVRLPSYPWQRERCWLDTDLSIGGNPLLPAPRADAGEDRTPAEPNRIDVSSWLYELRWEPEAKPAAPQPAGPQRWLIVADAGGVGARLAARLAEAGDECVTLSSARDGGHDAKLSDGPARWDGIVHLGSLDIAAGDEAAATACVGLHTLLGSLARSEVGDGPRLWLVTQGVHSVGEGSPARAPAQAPLWGLGRTLAQEHTRHWVGLVDLEPGASTEALADALHQELGAGDREDQVAHRGGRRYVARLVRREADAAASAPVRFRRDATYLVTGGLGALAGPLTRWMVAHGAARLILLGRTPLPPRRAWNDVDPDSRIGRKIAAVRALEALGASVHLAAVDVADEPALAEFLETFRAEGWPPIRGVFHLAGTAELKPVIELDSASLEAHLRPKLGGALALHRLTAGQPLDHFVLFSSAVALTGAPLLGAFGAASAALDALAEYRASLGLPAVAVDWGAWSSPAAGGHLARGADDRAIRRGTREFHPEQALAVLESVLAAPAARVVAMPYTDDAWVKQPPLPLQSPLLKGLGLRPEDARRVQPRPELRSPYEAPRTELERWMATLWAEILKVDRVGIHDDFFELGGDSLQGALLLNRIQGHFQEILHLLALFETPHIAGLAEYLRKHYPSDVKRLCPSEEVASPAEDDVPFGRPECIDQSHMDQMRDAIQARMQKQARSWTVGPKNPRAIFVLSPPRSGSTLLRVMLAGHPALFAPPELYLLHFDTLADRHRANDGPDSYRLEGGTRALMEAKGWSAAAAQEAMRRYEDEGMTTQEFYRLVQQAIRPRILVDKTPAYAMELEVLRRAELLFEEPFYIHLLRHPCGMVRSYDEYRLAQIWTGRFDHPYSPRQLGEMVWVNNNFNILEFLEGVPAARQFQLRFEDLVKRPEEVLRALCAAIGLEYHPEMAEPYHDKERRMVDGIAPESRMLGDQKFALKHQAIDPTVADRWQEEMTGDFLGPPARALAERLGYTIAAPPSHGAGGDGPAGPLRQGRSGDRIVPINSLAGVQARLDELSDEEVEALLRHEFDDVEAAHE
jgi:acyl transferase domain-containing protein